MTTISNIDTQNITTAYHKSTINFDLEGTEQDHLIPNNANLGALSGLVGEFGGHLLYLDRSGFRPDPVLDISALPYPGAVAVCQTWWRYIVTAGLGSSAPPHN